MHNRKLLIAILAIIVILAAALTTYVLTRPSAATITPQYYAKAKATPVVDKCLSANKSLKISASDRSTVEMIAMSHLIDVPAGTNVDVRIASYSKEKVTGSDIYPSKYGSYNFALEKQNGNWTVTSFQRCD